MKTPEQWVKEQRCPEEWASPREVKAIQDDARQDLIKAIREAMKLIHSGRNQEAINALWRETHPPK